MNRTSAFLGAAVVLLLTAVVVGLPRPTQGVPPPSPPPAPAPPLVVPPPTIPSATPGSLSLSGRLSHPYLAPGTSDVFATLEVQAVDVPGSRRAPVNLALVIDRSGSMSGAKIDQARRAAARLVDLLDEHDRLSIVHYGSDVRAMPGTFATEGNKARLKRYIAGITDEGGTNIGEGLEVGANALAQALSDFRVNRLLLLSDGQPTVGLTSAQGLAGVVGRIRQRGVSVTALGVGADFNEDLMQRLADVGGGSYGFIANASAMAALFERDLQQAGAMVARNVTLTFTVPAGVRFVEVYGRPTTQMGDTVSVTLPDFAARQAEKLVVHLRATPGSSTGTLDLARFTLAYADLLTERPADAQLALSALVTEDHTLAQARRDKDAVVTATRARAAKNYQVAAEAVSTGDFGRAQEIMQQNEVLFDDAELVGGAGAMAEERSTASGLFGLVQAAPAAAAPARAEAVKQMKSTSAKSAGRGASVY